MSSGYPTGAPVVQQGALKAPQFGVSNFGPAVSFSRTFQH